MSTPSSPSMDPLEPSPALCLTLPTAEQLTEILHNNLDSSFDTARLSWAHEVVRLVDRQIKIISHQPSSATLARDGPPPLPESINALIESAIPIIISFTTHSDVTISSLASFLKGHILSSGNCPEVLPKDPRQAFKDFEVAARAGYVRGWFRLGRDYESCGEVERARQCFERGVKKGDGECTYRMGMAHLMGQLDLPTSADLSIPLLRYAAERATVDAPQAAYVLGMLLGGESDQITIPPNVMLPATTPPCLALDAQHADARRLIHRAAYLCFPPALYKSGYMYEHASLTCAFDPLLSVQYYALASQCGEVEADMALSKWFLVGAEGAFEKNERMARTFAQKAAKAGLASGCFALGYYYELGIGGRQDSEQAKRWYAKAAQRGNPEATDRIRAISAGTPFTLSAQQHQHTLNTTLIRRRTAAKQKSDSLRRQTGRQNERAEHGARLDAIQEASRASKFGMHHSKPDGHGSSFSNADWEDGRGGLPVVSNVPGPSMRVSGNGSRPVLQHLDLGQPIAFPTPHVRQAGPSQPSPGPAHHHHSVPSLSLPLRSAYDSPSIPPQQSPYIKPLESRRPTVPVPHPPPVIPTCPSTPTLPLSTPRPKQSASPPHRPSRNSVAGYSATELGFEALSIGMAESEREREQAREHTRATYTLQDSGPAAGATPVQRHHREEDELEYKGVGTFEEMGFKSKPVEEEGCVVM